MSSFLSLLTVVDCLSLHPGGGKSADYCLPSPGKSATCRTSGLRLSSLSWSWFPTLSFTSRPVTLGENWVEVRKGPPSGLATGMGGSGDFHIANLTPWTYFLFSRGSNLEPQTFFFFLNGQTLNLKPFVAEICEPGDLEPQTLDLTMGDLPFFLFAQPNELTVVHRDYEQQV